MFKRLLFIWLYMNYCLLFPDHEMLEQKWNRSFEQNAPSQAQVSITVEEPDKPAMEEAFLAGNAKGFHLSNTYNIDMYSSEVVGMVGVPIEVSCPSDTPLNGDVKLIFVYDEEALDCNEQDLAVLWYNRDEDFYEPQEYIEANYEENMIAVPVKQQGTYILEDMATWISVWTGTYEYDEPKEPVCHWHNEFYYQDIEKLADISWYDESCEYHITTVEQLAGLVKLVNTGTSFRDCDFYLDADLDLAGYQWAPIGWYYPADDGYLWKDFPFEGRFFGNGHTIYNMHIEAPNKSDLGMFGRTLQSFEVHDLALKDCYIEGKYYVGGILGDNINSGDEYDMTNCFVSGTVKGKQTAGALVGSTARLKIKDCAAVMSAESTTELVGDLRSGAIENSYMNDDTAKKMLKEYEEKSDDL